MAKISSNGASTETANKADDLFRRRGYVYIDGVWEHAAGLKGNSWVGEDGLKRWMRHDGYIRVSVPGRGLVMEHRLVMERKLGRELEPHEWVNHIDEVRTNNVEDNLEVLPI